MGYARIWSRGAQGLDAPLVGVEVHLAGGLPTFQIVGLAATAVRESRDRVRGALATSGFDFPVSRITVNLTPADLPKHGGRYDLAIALGILLASEQLKSKSIPDFECFAELTLAGELNPIDGALPACQQTFAAGRLAIVAPANAAEARSIRDARVVKAPTLNALVDQLSGKVGMEVHRQAPLDRGETDYPDLADVVGQTAARRALEIAATGEHNLLLCGPPGSGKSMLAMRLPGLLPAPDEKVVQDIAALQSVSGVRGIGQIARPFRAPHHSTSATALIGGGSRPRPGEVSRAHGGVLFLDELPEFSRHALEMLREPLESGEVHLVRTAYDVCFPAQFQLIAAMNPCPCGALGEKEANCRCSAEQIQRYRGRLSGPLLDRIDLGVTVPRVPFEALVDTEPMECSADVARRVSIGRERAIERQGTSNARLPSAVIQSWLQQRSSAMALLGRAADQLSLSARQCHRVIRVSRTVADLADSPEIATEHVAEALSLRSLEV
ncbi:MAG: YifB family Mg chelatase-like AAA ATPase [Pseudomonadota bacterium]